MGIISKSHLAEWLLDASNVTISPDERLEDVVKRIWEEDWDNVWDIDNNTAEMRWYTEDIFCKSEIYKNWNKPDTSQFLVVRDGWWKSYNGVLSSASLAGVLCAKVAKSLNSMPRHVDLSYFCGSKRDSGTPSHSDRFPGDEGLVRFITLQLLAVSPQNEFWLPDHVTGPSALRNVSTMRVIFWELCKVSGVKTVRVTIHNFTVLQEGVLDSAGAINNGMALHALLDTMRPLVNNNRILQQNPVELKILVSNWSELREANFTSYDFITKHNIGATKKMDVEKPRKIEPVAQ